MAPQFVFRIDEFTEHPNADPRPRGEEDGTWKPWNRAGFNIRKDKKGVTYQWWCCDGKKIYPVGVDLPQGAAHYKTFSTVFGGGHGFWILHGDAVSPPKDGHEDWCHLCFDWDEDDLSSSLTNAGEHRTLRLQDSTTNWVKMLLPDIYHGGSYSDKTYGGLSGELGILLGLIALSMKPDRLVSELPKLMKDGEWGVHQRPHGRTDKRGVVVYVYTYNGNDEELEQLEDGGWGKYYH
ncbi:hypothetical protein EK21DRAFT_95473 [Setomelanomma holmii]|uniref:Uncharacterized protein n=1 Tax=Setomelanomma holmii TaxID=210430 RepID=A0A9P4LFZ8_9PLEO|nr:hypothetical protein EK21DRAFT_95473 [Setomelanomma holmii]